MMTALIIIGVIITAFIALQIIVRMRIKKMPAVEDHNSIITLTDKNFSVQTKGKVVLVDFWAAWCAPCKIMAPVLNKVAEELSGNKRIAKVNIQTYQILAKKFKVRSIPTLILLKNGTEIKRFVGVKSKEFLLQQINNVP